jgi:hypothetical protein
MPAVLGDGTSLAHETVISCKQVKVGGVASNTVIVWAHVAEFPQTSVALYVLVMVYRLAQDGLLITSLTYVTVTAPLQLSLAEIAAGSGAGTSLAQDTVRSGKQDKDGTVASNTVICWAQVALFPHTSVAL